MVDDTFSDVSVEEQIPPAWSSGRGIFGGYLVHRAVSWSRKASPRLHEPNMISASFVRAARPGPVISDVVAVHRGRSNSVIEMTMRQGQVHFVSITHLAPRSGSARTHASTDARSRAGRPTIEVERRVLPFAKFIECRELELETGKRTAHASMRCVADECTDSYSEISILLDAVDPLLVLSGSAPFVPTSQMQIDFHPKLWGRAGAGQEWLRVEQTLEWVSDTHCMETSTVRDARDVVLGRCRQVRTRTETANDAKVS